MEATDLIRIKKLKKSNLWISNQNKVQLLKKIIIFSLIIIVLLGIINIYLILNINFKKEIIKKLQEENPFFIENKDTTIAYNKNESYKDIPENILKYQNEIKLEYYKIQELINNHNYNIKDNIEKFIKKLGNLLISESDMNNSNNQSQVLVMNNNYNYSKFKNQYYIQIDNAFDKYRNETELTDEYKNKFKQDILNGYSSLFKKNYKNIDTIIFDKKMNFGNAMFVINNLIYYCELLGCKNI